MEKAQARAAGALAALDEETGPLYTRHDSLKSLHVEAWRSGMVCVQAIPAIGPDKGVPIVAVTPRDDLQEMIRDFIRRRPERALRRGLKREIRTALNAKATPRTVLDDIIILFALFLVEGPRALEGMGVASLLLLMDGENSSLPWHLTGGLDPAIQGELSAANPAIVHEPMTVH